MYIEHPDKKIRESTARKLDGFFRQTNKYANREVAPKKEISISHLVAERKEEIDEDKDWVPNNTLHSWRALEYEVQEKSQRWLFWAALVILAVVAWAIYTNSPVMAITFILIGVSGYIFINKKPKIIRFAITEDGLIAGQEIYDYYDIKSFWIFYEPGEIKAVSLILKGKLIPYVHLPLGDEDPVKIRQLLLEYLSEDRQTLSPVDKFERILGI
jgi:hypothetical protein